MSVARLIEKVATFWCFTTTPDSSDVHGSATRLHLQQLLVSLGVLFGGGWVWMNDSPNADKIHVWTVVDLSFHPRCI